MSFQKSLRGNNLSGPIPSEVGLLTNVVTLVLLNNGLTGSIATELGALTNCESIGFHNNKLNSTIPSELGLLTNLEVLNLPSQCLVLQDSPFFAQFCLPFSSLGTGPGCESPVWINTQ